ncbi:uncharacterized protein LOC127879147 isoform X1 [Dreissena polymorpha]|uniref:uncharacterized protein LOC127879147 isoform X1 n=1 Tax=Dreissena polymorpha TaxID=45954 RepID=UPI0022640B64|nr:uncharacterized protein LOC127879147 isoform X1 [Dreissena polymorpha]
MNDRTTALLPGANELEDSQNTSVSMLPLQSATRSAMGKLGLNAHRPMPTHLAPSQGAKHYNYGPGPMRTNFGPGHRPSNWSPSPMMPIVHRDSSSLDRSTAVRGLERPVSRSLDRCPSSLLDRGMGVHEMDVMATGFGYYGNHGALGDMEAAVTSSKPNNPQNSASKSKTKISAKKKSEGSSLDWMTSAPLGPTIPFTSRKYSAPLKPIASRSSKPLAQTKPSITTLSDNNLLTQARRQNEPLKSVPMPHRQDWVQQARASLKPAPLGAIKSKEDGISSAGWLTQARASLTPPTSPPPARAHWLDSDSELADDIMDKLRNEQENKPIHRLSAVMANVQKDMHYLDHSVQDVSGEKNKRQEVNQVTDINEKNKESNETLSAISEISEACITTKQEILKEIEASVDRAQIVTVLKSEILNGVEIPAVDDPECLKHNISKDESNPHMLAAITHANTEPSENTDSQQNPTSKNKYTNEELNNEIKKMLSERKIVRNSGPLEKTVFDEIQDSDDRIVIAEKKLEKQDCSIETHENGITNYEDDKSKISPELPMGCLYENKATLNDINSTKAIGDQYHTNTNDQFEELILERKKLRNQKSLHPICATIVSQKSKSSQADLCLAVPLPPNYKVPNNRFVTADENEEDVEFINLSVEDTVQGECLPAQVTEKQRASSLSLEAPSAQHEGSNRDDKFFEIDKKTKMQSMSITSPLERLSKEGFNVIQSFQSVKGNKPKHAQVKINDNLQPDIQ